MEVIKKQILINELADKVCLKINLSQSIDNLGLMTDMPFDCSYITPCTPGLPLEFMSDGIRSVWYRQGDRVTYASDSKFNKLKSYDKEETYKLNFDIKKENYSNFELVNINGVDRVTDIDDETITYVFDAKRNPMIGTTGQTTGILYVDNPTEGIALPDELDNTIVKTRVEYMSEGWNETNTSTDPQIQEEYLLGIISEPEVKSDVFIDRSTFSVLDKHLRLSEIESLDHLTRYGNGFYNINRD